MAWHSVAKTSEVTDGEVIGVEVEGTPIAIYNLDGEYFATHNVCTHAFALLSDGYVDDGKVECPLHQGIFDIRSGKAEEGPVDEDLKTFTVKVEGDELFVQL
ncbi:non-heme iron oxygenase ferredoxin subunit [Algihabitans sp.]|uniref:non-heme iron oxygenase ferredoxin subunit n=1 Tax=Algihabitans sp. TaxID=2821514 RepID=UPI003BA945D5